jgi:hypothetical protein
MTHATGRRALLDLEAEAVDGEDVAEALGESVDVDGRHARLLCRWL